MPPRRLSYPPRSGWQAEHHHVWGHWPVRPVRTFRYALPVPTLTCPVPIPRAETFLCRRLTLDQHIFPPLRSLQHRCLRLFAEHWLELSEYEQHYIPTLSIVTREVLLSYLTLYGEENCLGFAPFKILFQNVGDKWDDVRFLDLTGLLNARLTLNDLHRCLKRTAPPAADQTSALATLSIIDSGEGKRKTTPDDVAESWEDEDDVEQTPPPLRAQLTTPHFTNLARLSLAHAGQHASWPDLLKLSPALHKLTHLSLAYWPRPTLTPNSASTAMVAKHARLAFSGTSHYADLDDDYAEAANLLRRFSINTYSLEWLDLEGCGWIRALTWRDATHTSAAILPPPSSHPVVPWSDMCSTPVGPDWNAAWQRVTYLSLFQG
jgi:hypothetical protein